jgi:bifunctional non-homologous end joining protein LigD
MTNDFSLPAVPMAPLLEERLPAGPEWGYQLKWDGVRMIARLDGKSGAELYSRNMLPKNGTYPEIVALLAARSGTLGACILDGEVVYWDGSRPNFQKVLQRERIRAPRSGGMEANGAGMLVYVLFDLLYDRGEDLRSKPYLERHERLSAKFPEREPQLFVTDLFRDGESLWSWVAAEGWEGVVSKRLASPYREGKKHRDWLKKKTELRLDVQIEGIKLREGRIASLVMSQQGDYLGSVSLGLDERMKQGLMRRYIHPEAQEAAAVQQGTQGLAGRQSPFPSLPPDLKGETVVWLGEPFACRVTGLEMTSAGLLRHPKLVCLGEGGKTWP